MMHLTKSGMEKTPIPLPTMEEQLSIENKLSDEELLIRGNERLIEIFTQKLGYCVTKVCVL